MIKILLFVLIVIGLGYGFSLLAEMPGSLAVTIGDRLITVDLIVATALLLAIIVAVMFVWWVIKLIFTSPKRLTRHFRARKRDRGYQALSTGIIAAGAGDPNTARRMLKQANSQLTATSEPLVQLLDAQTTMLEGKHDNARKMFEDMLDDPETRSLALRGLYMEAQRLGDRDAQRHYAEKAAELAPQLAWAGKAAINHKTANGDWEGALRIVETQKSRKQIDRDEAKRKRAVLLTAMAMELVEAEPARAKSAALEAHKLAPAFAPAAIVCAEAAQRLNDMRKAIKVLETCWKQAPHPDVAIAYVNARSGDSVIDRLKRARKLEGLKPNNIESSMIVAQIALEAGKYEEARKAVAYVLREEPRESAYMLMADIEDAETGNQGKMREWLARAVHAPRDPAWTADGYVSQKWAPFSPVTGEIDAFEWKVPVERLGGPVLEFDDLDPMEAGITPAPVIGELPPLDGAEVDAGELIEVEEVVEEPKAVTDAEPIETSSDTDKVEAEKTAAEGGEEVETSSQTDVTAEGKTAETALVEADEPDIEAKAVELEEVQTPVADEVGKHEAAYSPEAEADEATPLNGKAEAKPTGFKPPIPDDPGVDPVKAAERKAKRFRLF
ncbi:MAG: heme biosynthesis protein HemY [Pseudomonadota bacterium]